ncbi:symmetrical bis(5'-nucleosyl)-tetraphosphatase [Alteromonas ponticola]|uniref:bis(5'-nucleosyl)-tetraphosphatase (symmetrical) n=1 Tax=Alteromonas aquimaris TaxID=2998417 RepID=A0ABT3P9G3_9ALTE|nr:symmetrical bis(5'-nucleosyl)-tetraphosphatase [Alteromonas aquimaris]MCW8109420.1 symmetrical bis(5'-nucleosyl)-tetraphosphatase [Alteromonas aquimaris]
MTRQSLIVGDIQGCLPGLKKLLSEAGFNPHRDHLYAVGDLIGRGPDSLGTAEYLMSLGDHFHAVLGNHDLNFLAVSQGLKQARKSDKLGPLLNSPKLPAIVNWFRHFPLAHRLDPDTVLVHAGLYPFWSVDDLLNHSDEISEILCSEDWRSLLKNMYGCEPRKWSSALFGVERQRFIVNACTRMRYLNASNQLDFENSGHPSDAPEELTPWFKLNNRSLTTERIVFGHWAALNGQTSSTQYIGLDTGYVWGKKMTALRLETAEFIAINAA